MIFAVLIIFVVSLFTPEDSSRFCKCLAQRIFAVSEVVKSVFSSYPKILFPIVDFSSLLIFLSEHSTFAVNCKSLPATSLEL